MADQVEIRLGEFARSTVTRRRGAEAAERRLELVFRVNDEPILEKLARTSGLREIPLRYLWRDASEPLHVAPALPPEMEVIRDENLPLDQLQAGA